MGRLKLFNRHEDDSRPTEGQNDNAQSGVLESQQDPIWGQNKELYDSDGESISSGQDGVKKAQATTIVWTRKALIVAYAL